jgi:hypothetical protein
MRWTMRRSGRRPRRPQLGDLVEVKSAEEILASLDADGSIGGLPFMPEMLRFAGQRFRVSNRAELACDTIRTWSKTRRVRDAVHLDDLRCDGSFHGGCQAGCRLYWKESWLKPAAADGSRQPAEPGAGGATPELLLAGTTQKGPQVDGAGTRFRCQATEMYRASEPMHRWDVRRYLRELSSRNVRPTRFVTVLVRAAGRRAAIRLRLRSSLPVRGACAGPTPKIQLGLQPGEWVRVKSKEQIAATLNQSCKNRGLWFDWEMLPHAGRTYRVQERISRIVDERSGELIEINSDTLVLEGVACSGDHSSRRLFCTRAIYPYWREAWLERVQGPPPPAPAVADGAGSSNQRG